MNLILSFLGKYIRPIETYGYSFLGLIAGSGSGAVSLSASTSALAAAFPAVTHLIVEVVKDVKDAYALLNSDLQDLKASAVAAEAEVKADIADVQKATGA